MNARKLGPLVVVIAGLLAYHNSFTGPFIFDDVHWIPENSTIRHLWPIWDVLSPPSSALVNARPVVNFSLAVNYALGGYSVWGWHALNLTIHILAGLTLLGIVRRTLLQPPLRERFGAASDGLALATALIWTVHPLQTESVTYIIQRAESIMGLFYLLTLYSFIRGAASPLPRLWYGLCVGACALGMASKEVMVSAPLMVMLYDRTFVSGSFREAWRQRRALYLGLSATWILQGFMLVSAGTFKASAVAQYAGAGKRWEYLLTEPGVILHYLRLAAWPYPLCFDYYGWPLTGAGLSVLLPTLVIAILLGATAWTCKTNSAWGVLGAWFFLILAPSSSIIPLDSPAYEHRMYLPLAAVVTGGVVVAFTLGKRLLNRQPGVVLGCLATGSVVVALTGLTIQRNRDYRSELTIWQDTVEKRPNNPRALGYLGNALAESDDVPAALGRYQQALRIKPDDAEVHYNLGRTLQRAGRLPEAMDHYQQAVRLEPDYAEAYNNLGVGLQQTGNLPEAIADYQLAVRLKPGLAAAHYNLAEVLATLGRAPEAVDQYQRALRYAPDHFEAHYHLANALARSGRFENAIPQYQEALRLKPEDAEVHLNLGAALVRLGRPETAIQHYQEALRIQPDYAAAHNSLANALAGAGRVEEAIGQYQQALQILPNSAEIHCNLAVVLERAGRVPEAIEQYQQALRLRSDLTTAKTALSRLQAGP